MTDFDDMKFAVESLSGGKNTVILDDIGMPSVMAVLPKMTAGDICAGSGNYTHPAFIVDGAEKEKVALSKYLNIVLNNRAYSLPMRVPEAGISWTGSLNACRQKGNGWGLTPASLWSAAALWSKKNGTLPHGNGDHGKDIYYPHEKGVVVSSSGITGITAAGSGPATWNHDHTMFGISDMSGNLWDWCAGMRLVRGEIQIIPDADCMKYDCDMSRNSTEWKAIKEDGSLVAPGTEGTLKYILGGGIVKIGTYASGGAGGTYFQDTKAADGVTIPQILKELTLFPADESGYGSDYSFFNNSLDECMLLRGGRYQMTIDFPGVFYTNINNARNYGGDGKDTGFRSAFYGDF